MGSVIIRSERAALAGSKGLVLTATPVLPTLDGGAYYEPVQRLFSMFPTGLPGAALLLLRVCVIGMLIDSIAHSSETGNITLGKALPLALISFLLLLGAFTPITSMVSIILDSIYWPTWDTLRSFEFALQALVMLALFLLGPGAYSLDAKMFGRRLILPPE
jgi:hypothetical protein